jgi:hypothetical protein
LPYDDESIVFACPENAEGGKLAGKTDSWITSLCLSTSFYGQRKDAMEMIRILKQGYTVEQKSMTLFF